VRVNFACLSRVVGPAQCDPAAHVPQPFLPTNGGERLLKPALEPCATLQDQVTLLECRSGRGRDLEFMRLGSRRQQNRELDVGAAYRSRGLADLRRGGHHPQEAATH